MGGNEILVAVQFDNSTEIVLGLEFAAARSCLPSWLKSPTATDLGLLPIVYDTCVLKVPVPVPISTDTELEPSFIVTKSSIPSPLKSPTVTEVGVKPTP